MALQKFPVEIPLGGAVNEGDVPVVVQPPRILEAENCHSIKGGAYQKRDDDVAVSAPPGEPPFAIGTTDESAITFARLEAQAWTGEEWEQKPACATIAGEARSFYPTDGGELNLSPDLAVTPAQASANEERICAAWYTDDPTLQNKTAYRIFGGPDRRPVIPERRLPVPAPNPLQEGAVWVRSVETAPGVFDFVIVTADGAGGVMYRLDADGSVITAFTVPTTNVVVDVQAANDFLYLLVHAQVAPGDPPPQNTDYQVIRVQVSAPALPLVIGSGTYPATTSAPCGLFLLGAGATVIFSDGTATTFPIGGGAGVSISILTPCADTIGTAYPIPAPPSGSYIPPGQIRPRCFLSYDEDNARAWVGINTQAFQQLPLFPGDFTGQDQPPGRPLGESNPDAAGYNFPSWSNGLYGCAYVEHTLCAVALDGSLSPTPGAHGILQGAAVAGGGYYSETTGHTALLCTPAPANLFTDDNLLRTPPIGPDPSSANYTAVPREDWVQPTVMWCARDVVPAYDAVTPVPAAAPASFAVRNQALSIGCFLPNAGTLAEVRGLVVNPGTGLQNTAGASARPSIAATERGAVMMTLEWEAVEGPEVAQPKPLDPVGAGGSDIVRSTSSSLNGALSASRPRVFDFVEQASIDMRAEAVSVATAGPQPITIGRATPLAAGNPLQAPIITYGCPAQATPAVLASFCPSVGGVPLQSGEVEPVKLEELVFEGQPWPVPATDAAYVCTITLRTMLSAIDSDDEQHRSTPWLPNPLAPTQWWGQTLYSEVTVGVPEPSKALPTSVSVVISPVAWQLMGVPATARYDLQLTPAGPSASLCKRRSRRCPWSSTGLASRRERGRWARSVTRHYPVVSRCLTWAATPRCSTPKAASLPQTPRRLCVPSPPPMVACLASPRRACARSITRSRLGAATPPNGTATSRSGSTMPPTTSPLWVRFLMVAC